MNGRATGPGQAHWLPGRTALYRFFDAAGQLLYVGITANLVARFAAHESSQSWWSQVDMSKTTVEWRDTRDEAEAAEDAAMLAEHPLHNVAGSPWAPKPRELASDEATIAELRANLSEAVNRVRLLGKPIVVVDRTRGRKPVAALVPASLMNLMEQAGGMDAAAEILRKAAQ